MGSEMCIRDSAITIPLYRYDYFGYQSIESIGGKNGFRMASYHRMDLSLELQSKKNARRKRYKSAWNFGVYNIYNRNNPYFVTTGQTNEGQRTFRQISIFPFIPSVSYKFKF